ncbi:unnamed protein product [Acanthosepion pharaonis]|uniref:Uncharacterized protein n=1 Tax=Acanthosepion pharaonis TaxID=158019 RepID=A0A812BPB7_ACAPH|nr:unnamed protein product [Sepia pharaonis]
MATTLIFLLPRDPPSPPPSICILTITITTIFFSYVLFSLPFPTNLFLPLSVLPPPTASILVCIIASSTPQPPSALHRSACVASPTLHPPRKSSCGGSSIHNQITNSSSILTEKDEGQGEAVTWVGLNVWVGMDRDASSCNPTIFLAFPHVTCHPVRPGSAELLLLTYPASYFPLRLHLV